MKPTTSRTGLHKVRMGDLVVVTSANHGASNEAVTKVGRLFVHTRTHGAFRIDDGTDKAGMGGSWRLWHEENYHTDTRRSVSTGKIRALCGYHSTTLGKATQDQLDRILAILEEVPT